MQLNVKVGRYQIKMVKVGRKVKMSSFSQENIFTSIINHFTQFVFVPHETLAIHLNIPYNYVILQPIVARIHDLKPRYSSY